MSLAQRLIQDVSEALDPSDRTEKDEVLLTLNSMMEVLKIAKRHANSRDYDRAKDEIVHNLEIHLKELKSDLTKLIRRNKKPKRS